MKQQNFQKKGIFLIELLVIFAIASVFMGAIASFLIINRSAISKSYIRQKASDLNNQQLERVKALWKNDWDLLADGRWHLELAGSDWQLADGLVSEGYFTKYIDILPVYRSADGEISSEGSLLDPSSKKITATILWGDLPTESLSYSIILNNLWNYSVWHEDTFDDFSDGIEDVTDFSSNPGYIQLAQTGGGGWSEPRSLGTVDGDHKASGICHSSNYLYLTQHRAFGRIEVFNIDNPEIPEPQGTFPVLFMPNDCAITNNYLYLANNLFILPSVSIYNITNPLNPSYVGQKNIIFPAGSVAADNNYLYVSVNNDNLVLVYSLQGNHYTNPQYLGWFNTSNDITDMALSGNYLYISQTNRANGVMIYDISSNPSSPEHVGTVSLLYSPTGIGIDGGILYISLNFKRGAMMGLNNPSSPQLFGYFPTDRNSADITAVGDYGYVAGADSQSKVIEVFDLSDSKGISGTYFVYGEYVSSSFSTGSPISSYRIDWEGETTLTTNLYFQFALNNDNNTWNFVGPDGTPGSYFEVPGSVYFPDSIGTYLRYKLILTGDGDQTPVLDSVTVSYAD